MRASTIWIVGAVSVAALLTPVVAQSGNTHRRSGQVNRRPGPGNQGVTVTVPPPLVTPLSTGLVEQGFMYMRNTAPRPNEFLHGRWNPHTYTIYPHNNYIQPGWGHYPHGYHGGLYGGGYFNGGYFNFGYNPYNTIQQREYFIIRDGLTQLQQQQLQQQLQQLQQQQQQQRNAQQRETPTPPAEGRGRPAPDPDRERSGEAPRGEFYLRDRGMGESVTTAVDDIRRAWLNGDFQRLRARFADGGKVRIFLKGQLAYSVESKDFAAILEGAMKNIDTLAFDLEAPRVADSGKTVVFGKHTFLDSEKVKVTTHISYGLQRIDGKWRIVEAGSSSEPYTAHKE